MKHFVIYHNYIPKVGGIETAIYNLAKVMSKHYKVTIAFQTAESNDSLFKYSEYADVVRVKGRGLAYHLECDVCLIASNHIKPKEIIAKKYFQWIHSDYRKYNLKFADNKEVSKYIAVSNHAGVVFRGLYHKETTTIQNILDPDFKLPEVDNRKTLNLVTNSRISPEKGFGRMLTFAEGLRDAGIKFSWEIYGDNSHFPKEMLKTMDDFKHLPQVVFLGFKEDVRFGLAKADYLVQLSDFEGCPYSVLEALKVGVPCILTNFDSAGELVEDGVNGYLVPLNMQGIDYQKIAKKIPKDFKFSQDHVEGEWLKLIG